MCRHGFHFIHEMHYSSIAYFQCVMTGKGVKREAGVWSWQETRPDPLYYLLNVRLVFGLGKKQDLTLCITSSLKSQEYVLFIVGVKLADARAVARTSILIGV
ncbi:hypothetical protein [Pseudoalteromonas fuliginea]|uniref:Uncharacterized protein n=1 Tax=Pseudoalteromonas fuliginea TaxID=1872678 RepID=A0ABQ6RD89_9GAMM|nr:hypothetical protein [Pseudoalteromonas fuliginea]KAA1150499.1 hypothetical protein EU509_20565 [Pseudoalteromonas fuliginea]KAA1165238.1 hypothetical protein EUZ79_20550 [Pseudoalteromonas fuliginea]